MSDPHRAEPRRRAPLRPPTSRGRHTAALSATLAACLVLAGCTQIPQSSPVRTGEPLADNRASADTPQFRPPGPADGADAEEVIRGFILAGTSPQDDYEIAREHLTGPATRQWNPAQRTVVYSAQPTITRVAEDSYQIQVEVDSEVDEYGLRTMAPPGSTRAWEITLDETEQGPRISAVDDGTLLSLSQFTQVYAPHDLVFFDQTMTYAVADVRWFVNRGTTVTAATRALLHGPAPYLTGATVSAFPVRSGTDLTHPAVPVDEAGVARVDLVDAAVEGADAEARYRMEEQLRLTLTGLASVNRVEVSVEGAPLASSGGDATPVPVQVDPPAESVQVGVAPSTGGLAFFQGLSVTPVGGVPNVADLHPAVPAMSRDRTRFAFLTQDRTSLYLATAEGRLEQAVRGTGLTPPSIDALGWAWTVDAGGSARIQASPLEPGGDGSGRVVTAPWLEDGERIVALRISRGGARAALVVDDGERRTVRVAGVVRGSDGVPASLTEPLLLPSQEDPDLVEWVGDTSLIASATARDEDDRVTPEIIDLDGTTRQLNPLSGLTGVSAGDRGTLYAETQDTVFMLVGSSWRAQELSRPVRDLAFPG
ncbi:LpqB family beta-propeller domain-containing protein [Micrococcus sp. 2A]|uniref:LpqB family beta-propeller domain-containing protein n=1 Tax=unclassified Micrococcus TaxID=2620948 RepID=UPI002005C362|nr:LpqB family beta-propeller domain-containing protein [uncultured Micrococcus sp.]MCK6095763.1 GerMN domain-containing protein [Micrococcus sp. EYE_212]MCK6172504.1 GerMN domain-containing protein [Micrococcus sp. EYE_162]